MALKKTAKFYKQNPPAAARRREQQQAYNLHGSSKPGTKNITGNQISENARKLRNQLGITKAESKRGIVAAHYEKKTKNGKQNGRRQHVSINSQSRLKKKRTT